MIDSYPFDPQRVLFIAISTFVLNFCFLVELVVKVLALGCRAYMKDAFNVLTEEKVEVSCIE